MVPDLARRLAIARGDAPADLVLRGGRVLSVFTGELIEADVAICDEHVAGVGRGYEGKATSDVSGLILLPGFIDGHMHLESTKLMVDEFARAALPWGTTTVVLIRTRSRTSSGSTACARSSRAPTPCRSTST
jgi:adenine deaminase